MKTKRDATESKKKLRRDAELKLSDKVGGEAGILLKDPMALVYELKVHQVELEMQNEELRRAWNEADELSARYRDLYDFAPIPYFILDDRGVIVDANLTAASLLGVERRSLFHQPFMNFLAQGCIAPFKAFVLEILISERKQTCQVELVGKGESTVHAIIEGIAVAASAGKGQEILLALLDITDRVRTEQQLRDSEERFHATFNEAAVGVGHVDSDGTLLRINRKYCEIFGYTEAELKALTIEEITHPDDREATMKYFRELLDGKIDNYSLDKRYIRKDGSVVWVNLTASLVRDANGNPKFAVGFAEDITLRKRAEDALRKSEAKFVKVFHTVPALLSITTLREGRIIDINETALQTLGYLREEMIGRTLDEIGLCDQSNAGKEVFQRLLVEEAVHNLEVGFKGKTGRRLVGLLSAELIEFNGDRAVLCMVKDITMRKQAEEALVQAKEEWERTFDSVPDLIAILDDRNRIMRVNRAMAERLGRQPEECIGQICYEEIHGAESPPDYCPHAGTLADGRRHDAEMHEERLGGDFLVSSIPLPGPDGRMTGVVHVARDITERKLADARIATLNAELAARAAELEAANRELDTFNYTVAHDLRRPLTVINLLCQTLDELCTDSLDTTCRGYLRETYNGTVRMNRLIEALLNFSRLAHIELRREEFDLTALARTAATELKLADPDRRVTFRIADGMRGEGDVSLLRVVLDNLFGNAWKFSATRDEAIIEFGQAEIQGEPTFFVRDNGAGFEMAVADRLFLPFQRLPGAEEAKGFGIGLATVDRIIRRHGGRVWAESEPGKGATFRFTLPEARSGHME